MVKPARPHTRFEKARIIGARALQISMGAPLFVSEDELRDHFSDELIQLYGVEEAQWRVVLDPNKIAMLEYEQNRIPIDVDPHDCLLYTSPSPRDKRQSRMPSSA